MRGMGAFGSFYPAMARSIATIHIGQYAAGRAVHTSTHGIDRAIVDSMSASVHLANPKTCCMRAFRMSYPTTARSIAATHTGRYSAGRAVHTSTHVIDEDHVKKKFTSSYLAYPTMRRMRAFGMI